MLRVRKTFTLTFGGGITLTWAKVVTTYLKARRHWQVVSGGASGWPDNRPVRSW